MITARQVAFQTEPDVVNPNVTRITGTLRLEGHASLDCFNPTQVEMVAGMCRDEIIGSLSNQIYQEVRLSLEIAQSITQNLMMVANPNNVHLLEQLSERLLYALHIARICPDHEDIIAAATPPRTATTIPRRHLPNGLPFEGWGQDRDINGFPPANPTAAMPPERWIPNPEWVAAGIDLATPNPTVPPPTPYTVGPPQPPPPPRDNQQAGKPEVRAEDAYKDLLGKSQDVSR